MTLDIHPKRLVPSVIQKLFDPMPPLGYTFIRYQVFRVYPSFCVATYYQGKDTPLV